jgi:hypothetical protein
MLAMSYRARCSSNGLPSAPLFEKVLRRRERGWPIPPAAPSTATFFYNDGWMIDQYRSGWHG